MRRPIRAAHVRARTRPRVHHTRVTIRPYRPCGLNLWAMIAATQYFGEPMSQLPPAPAPQQPGLDTLKVRGRRRGVWLALWLAGAAGCVAVGLYEDTAEPWSHA